MTQLSLSAARVIDPILTTIAQGYENAEFVGSSLFPAVPVGQRGGKILQFGKESFMVYDTARAPGGAVKRLTLGYAGLPFALTDHALAAVVPVEEQEEAIAVPGVNMASASVATVQDVMRLRLEYEQSTLATTAANYGAANKVTLAGTSQWSDITTGVSDPIANIETAKDAIRSQIGKRPNTVIMGAAVFKMLRQHPKIIDRIKYTGRDVPTTDLLAALFGVSRVLVGDAVVSDDLGVFTDVWGKFVVVAYTEMGSRADRGRPTFGYTYQLTGYPFVESPRYDGDTRSWLYDVADAVKPVIVAASAGYLISGAVA
jgi:hypothetical protein